MNAWSQILAVVEPRIGKQNFTTWLKPATFHKLDAGVLSVRVDNSTMRDWINENYLDAIMGAAAALNRGIERVDFFCNVTPTTSGKPSRFGVAAPSSHNSAFDSQEFGGDTPDLQFSVQPQLFDADVRRSSPINPRYTFASFVTGESNKLAAVAAERVADDPASHTSNPLFIYGPVGLGKTHLLHAIANKLATRHPGWNICCMSAERFMNEFIESTRGDVSSRFRSWIRTVDALLVDDIQMLRGPKTQDDFFHTFNAVYEAQKQIVITSDNPPATLDLQERLQSRFGWGLVVDIYAPTLEVRAEILRRKAREFKFAVSEDVIQLIAARVTSNVRILESCMHKLIAHEQVINEAVTLEVALRVLTPMFPPVHQVTMKDIVRVVADHYDMRPEQLKIRSNTRRIVQPRQVAMWMARELTDMSLGEIALAFGNMNHSSVVYSVQSVEKRKQTDRQFSQALSKVCSEVSA